MLVYRVGIHLCYLFNLEWGGGGVGGGGGGGSYSGSVEDSLHFPFIPNLSLSLSFSVLQSIADKLGLEIEEYTY